MKNPCPLLMILGSLALGINLQGGQKTSKKKIGRNFPLAKKGNYGITGGRGRSPYDWGLAAEGEALTIKGAGGRGRSPYDKAVSYTHPCTVSWDATIQDNAMQCNAMQCNAMAQPNARENAMSCSVPCIRCPRALAMPSSPIF